MYIKQPINGLPDDIQTLWQLFQFLFVSEGQTVEQIAKRFGIDDVSQLRQFAILSEWEKLRALSLNQLEIEWYETVNSITAHSKYIDDLISKGLPINLGDETRLCGLYSKLIKIENMMANNIPIPK